MSTLPVAPSQPADVARPGASLEGGEAAVIADAGGITAEGSSGQQSGDANSGSNASSSSSSSSRGSGSNPSNASSSNATSAASEGGSRDEASLPAGLKGSSMPRHVAIILDGNSRWAKRRGLPSDAGHEAGVRSLKEVVRLSGKWGIQALTVFAFSTENWNRPALEVEFLMALLEQLLDDEVSELNRQNVVVRVIGEVHRLPERLQRKIQEVRELTKGNSGLRFSLAISYSGRQDIVSACKWIAEKAARGEINPEDVDDKMVEAHLWTNWLGELANPDLLIRSSGEQRISNFLLWQAAYSELYFSPTLWPDFGEKDYRDALLDFQSRDRRYGRRKES